MKGYSACINIVHFFYLDNPDFFVEWTFFWNFTWNIFLKLEVNLELVLKY